MTATNYAVAPGEYLEEWIDDRGFSQQHVADLLGCSRKQVNEIVNGRAPVTSDTAIRLERVVGIPACTWLRYEATYRADLARIADQENLAVHADEIDANAVTYLRSLGATKATKATPGVLVSDFLTFHRCGTWESYVHLRETAWTGDYALAALKESGAMIAPTVLTSWLRAAELHLSRSSVVVATATTRTSCAARSPICARGRRRPTGRCCGTSGTCSPTSASCSWWSIRRRSSRCSV